jgi:hypothetical protein
MRRLIISIAIIVPVVLGAVMSALSLTTENFVHISALYPEYSHIGSRYIDARGFPVPLWASNDPAISGYGESKQAILWSGVLSNTLLWTMLFGVLELPALLVILVMYVARRTWILKWVAARWFDPVGWPGWVASTKLRLFLWALIHIAVLACVLLAIINTDGMLDARTIRLVLAGYPCLYLWTAYPLLRSTHQKQRSRMPRCEEGARQ